MKKLLVLLALFVGTLIPHAASAQFNGCLPGFCGAKISAGAALACSYTPVTTGTQGTAYTGATPSASGGTPSYTFSETGTLPTGLSISSSTGIISGTPSVSGSFGPIQVSVTDSASTVANCGSAFTLVIAPASSFSLTPGTAANSGSALTGSTYDYGTLSYGSGCTRVIVGTIYIPGGTTGVTGVTVGGVALAKITSAAAIQTGIATDAWQSSAALAGSSGDVQITYASNLAFVSTAAVYCLVTTTPAAGTPATATQLFATTISAGPVTIPTGGGALMISGAANGHAATFVNASSDLNPTPGGNNEYFGRTTSTGSSVTVTANYASNDAQVLSVIPWGP